MFNKNPNPKLNSSNIIHTYLINLKSQIHHVLGCFIFFGRPLKPKTFVTSRFVDFLRDLQRSIRLFFLAHCSIFFYRITCRRLCQAVMLST